MALELKKWVRWVFDGPATYVVWRSSELDQFCGPDEPTLRRLTEVFENAAGMLEPYSDASINQAFWDLRGYMNHAVLSESIEWVVRERFIRSFEQLFREFFAVRCKPVLGCNSEEGSPLNSVCYMWFEINGWHWHSPVPLSRNRLDSAFLASMQSILAIDHAACQEAALHGLGHWHESHPAEVQRIIDEFLERKPQLREELREYACDAREGLVQ